MLPFRLRFPVSEVDRWSEKYTDGEDDAEPVRLGEIARESGFLTREQFLKIAGWKSPRPAKRHALNDEAAVRGVTAFSFGTPVEGLRLRALTLLDGIQARSASALLHLCHRDPYPLMDVRAFWSLGIETEPRDWFEPWPDYVRFCRQLAKDAKRSMRTLDRALWGYSFHQQEMARPPRTRGTK